MYAIIRKDGKQFRVCKGDTIRFNRIKSELGSVFEADEVLAIGDKDGQLKFGEPLLKDTKVVGRILSHGKDNKIIVFKRKRRKTYRRKYGHRQLHTMVKIESIIGKSSSEKKNKSEKVLPKNQFLEEKQQKNVKSVNIENKKVKKEEERKSS